MTSDAQIKALAAAGAASEALSALILYAREGGDLDIVFEADAIGKLADALKIAIDAYWDVSSDADRQLYSALISWIEYIPA